jgi:mRNA-degrading endonuclease RelE of RelBE toxin-antitoxin system
MDRYKIQIKKRVLKRIGRMPVPVQRKLERLLQDLRDKGPFRPEWPNYSKLGQDKYHRHLDYSHVVCWTYGKNTILIEVYYVGSRQSAPY